MSIKIKICGLSRKEDVEAVNEFLPDYIGFVFAETSKRRISADRAAVLAEQVSPGIRKTGIFVNEAIPFITKMVENHVIDAIQLHGQEDEEYIKRLEEALNAGKRKEIQIIQAFSVTSAEDIRKAEKSSADMILLDKGRGGTGSCFDWKLAGEMGRPFFLAGGLNEENVEEAIRLTRPYGLDLSSGAETNGIKDKEKIERIIRRIRNGKRQIWSPRRTVYTGNTDE